MFKLCCQVKKGTGFILEPYQGDESKTLAAFYFHVSCLNILLFIYIIDTKVIICTVLLSIMKNL